MNENSQRSQSNNQKCVCAFTHCVTIRSVRVWYHLTDKRETEMKRWIKKGEAEWFERSVFLSNTSSHQLQPTRVFIQMSLIYMKIKRTNQTYTRLFHVTPATKRNENALFFICMCAKGNPFLMPRIIIALQRHAFCSLIASYKKSSLWGTQLNAIWPHQIQSRREFALMVKTKRYIFEL